MPFTLFSPTFDFRRLFEQHFAIHQEAVGLLQGICARLADAPGLCQRLQAAADRGTVVAREVDRQLSLTLIKPLDRQDILALNRAFEDALKSVRAAAVRLSYYHPAETTKAVRDLSGLLVEITAAIGALLPFLGTEGSGEEQTQALQRLRQEADAFLLVAVGELYDTPPQTLGDTVERMKWSQLYDRLEDALDRTGQIAEVVRSIILKNV